MGDQKAPLEMSSWSPWDVEDTQLHILQQIMTFLLFFGASPALIKRYHFGGGALSSVLGTVYTTYTSVTDWAKGRWSPKRPLFVHERSKGVTTRYVLLLQVVPTASPSPPPSELLKKIVDWKTLCQIVVRHRVSSSSLTP